VEYYSTWAKNEPAVAPRYRAISGMGDVGDITGRVLEALSK
jgi:adenylate kinase